MIYYNNYICAGFQTETFRELEVPSMNLKEQTYVCALARCGTITKAAEELFLTAPALSMFLSNLEKNLGVQLFSRTGKTLEPTPIGQEYIHCASQMLRLKEEFDQKLSQETGLNKPVVRIGIQERRAISAMPWLIQKTAERLPNVQIVFLDGNHSELLRSFEQHQADYLFYTMEDHVPGAEYVCLKEEPVLAAIPEGHPCCCLARRCPGLEYPCLELADLDGETLILPPKTQSMRLTMDRLLAAAKVRPARIIEFRHFASIIGMVSKGLGIGFNRLEYLKDMHQPENVQYYFLGQPPISTPIVLLYAKEKKNSPFHEAIIQVFDEYLYLP